MIADMPRSHPVRHATPAISLLLLAATLLTPGSALAIDLASAHTTRLDNGLTLMVLEDHNFPVVSVQMLYMAGARNEEAGRTGLAHFLEHMAFRATENFPDTQVVSAIYAVGGEWHGYTWLDQTTYFETAPAEDLDLLLRIEADRMHRLVIPEADVEAERGAVLSELHGYENDPASVLHDLVLAASFLQHPYRNNTIGWESDVEKIDHHDLVEFYLRHYQPGNAVLAVVGDVSPRDVEKRVRELYGGFPGSAPTPPPRTVEPPQRGERRVTLEGAGERSFFELAYRAPSTRDPDWPAFLLLQDLLGGGDGVNFAQNEWGSPVRRGALLDGVTDDLATWFPPQAQPYVFTITGTIGAEGSPQDIEQALDERFRVVRQSLVSTQDLKTARERVLMELVFDVETTEDAAHQLAYFEGLGALDVLLGLSSSLADVGPDDIRRVARTYLQPWQRTVGWYLAGSPPPDAPIGAESAAQTTAATGRSGGKPGGSSKRVGEPVLLHLENGIPLIVQPVSLAPSIFLRILLPGNSFAVPGDASIDGPIWRHSSLDFRSHRRDLRRILGEARAALEGVAAPAAGASPDRLEDDPQARLQASFRELLGVGPVTGDIAPLVILLVGDLDPETAYSAVDELFGDLVGATPLEPVELKSVRSDLSVAMDAAKPQAGLGYVVTAAPPSHPDNLEWEALLYILTHGYEGRLGKEAVSRQGLIYYIDSDFHSDGHAAWIALEIGVDPPKLAPMRELLQRELEGLKKNPPTPAEVEEAKQHLIGRRISAAQSPEEISSALLREWIGFGRLRTFEEYAKQVSEVSREDVLRIVPDFTSGSIVSVTVREETAHGGTTYAPTPPPDHR
jgi:zinc protease